MSIERQARRACPRFRFWTVPCSSPNVHFGTLSVRAGAYRARMPQWIILMMVAIGAWLVVSIGGGLVVGRLLGLVSRRRVAS
jgi:hypothetical protein